MVQDCRLISFTDILARDALNDYLVNNLQGVVPDRYKQAEGRITILDD
jgi:hypothetical protein